MSNINHLKEYLKQETLQFIIDFDEGARKMYDNDLQDKLMSLSIEECESMIDDIVQEMIEDNENSRFITDFIGYIIDKNLADNLRKR